MFRGFSAVIKNQKALTDPHPRSVNVFRLAGQTLSRIDLQSHCDEKRPPMVWTRDLAVFAYKDREPKRSISDSF